MAGYQFCAQAIALCAAILKVQSSGKTYLFSVKAI
jgi:hypothetical protein